MTPLELAELLGEGRKYREICRATLLRISRWALSRSSSRPQAIKIAKKKLHQVFGAYISSKAIERAGRDLRGLGPHDFSHQTGSPCLKILSRHVSTRERIPFLGELYEWVFSRIGDPATILDLGCGFNPFSLPWMRLGLRTCYIPIEIHERLVAIINEALQKMGRERSAVCSDILSHPPRRHADLVLLLKVLPCLEQQEKGASVKLLKNLAADAMLISFPCQSLGGRYRSMRKNYELFMRDVLKEAQWEACIEKHATPTEIFFFLTRD